MKPLITYSLIFLAACLNAQLVEDHLKLNKVKIPHGKSAFSVDADTAKAEYLRLYSNGKFRASFNVVSGAYLQESDKRNKREIRALEEGTLQKVLALRPVSYLMKNQENRDRSIGLVAQEARTIFPALVTYVEEEEKLTISYIELIPLLIKALQEQQHTIDRLKKNQFAVQKEIAHVQAQLVKIGRPKLKEELALINKTLEITQHN